MGGNGDDKLSGGSGNDSLIGGKGWDSMHGGAGNDWMWGGDGHDVLEGFTGDDHMFGGNGNDVLNGGTGNNRMSGGAGYDTFVITEGLGRDLINDFENGVDILHVHNVSDVNNLSVQNLSNGDANVFAGSDLLAVVVGAAGELQLQGHFLF